MGLFDGQVEVASSSVGKFEFCWFALCRLVILMRARHQLAIASLG